MINKTINELNIEKSPLNQKNKCGYISFLGAPNAGKSTLLNACIGTKVSAVSQKPQTTRNRILGILTKGLSQFLFLDTPGIHDSYQKNKLNKLMNHEAWGVLSDSNVICYLIDIESGLTEKDLMWLQQLYTKYSGPIFILLTKSDRIKKETVQENYLNIQKNIKEMIDLIDQSCLKTRLLPESFVVLSAKRPAEVSFFIEKMEMYLPSNEWLFDEDSLTDRSQKFICAEFIREQIFRQLGEELPYRIAVKTELYEDKKNLVKISATIYVERETHKGMVVGKGGVKIKNIGTDARISIEKHLDKKVFLELFVKVQNGWTDDLNRLEYLTDLQLEQ